MTFVPSRRSHLIGRGMALIALVLTLLLVLAACGGSSTTASNVTPGPSATATPTPLPAPNDLITPGTLTVGSDTTYPPQEFINTSTNQPTGFDIDLVTAIAQRMGLHVLVKSTNFNTILDDLTLKRFDIVISAVTINPQREQKVDFIPYFNAGESLLVQAGNPHHITSIADLCGMAVAAQTNTVELSDLQAQNAKCPANKKMDIRSFDSQDDVVLQLVNGRVVATYQDSPVTDYYLQQHPGAFQVGGTVVNAAPEGIVIRKGDTSMYNAVKAAFDSLVQDGTYDRLLQKWNLMDNKCDAACMNSAGSSS